MSDYGYCPTCQAPGVKRAVLPGETKCLNGHWHKHADFNPPPPPRAREQSVEQYFVMRVSTTGGEVRKVQWLGINGAPDRLAGWKATGKHGLVELKRPFGTAEAHQVREHGRLRAIGLRVDIIDTKEAVDAYVAEMSS